MHLAEVRARASFRMGLIQELCNVTKDIPCHLCFLLSLDPLVVTGWFPSEGEPDILPQNTCTSAFEKIEAGKSLERDFPFPFFPDQV